MSAAPRTALSRAAAPALAAIVAAFGITTSAQQAPAPDVIFRTSRDVVSIDVIVRDRAGAIVRGLSEADFEIREDGRPEEVLTSSFQEVDASASPGEEMSILQRLGSSNASGIRAAAETADVSGRRLILLLFDLSSMEPEEVDRSVEAALRFVDERMTTADLVAIATLTWELRVLTDFVGNRDALREILRSLVAVDVFSAGPSADAAVESTVTDGSPTSPVAATEARLRALRLVADTLAPITQKKALLYFTGGLGNSAQDTPTELRAATTAASRANLAIYPVDARGLQAVIPSGPARVASRSGEGLFSGRDVNDQFSDLTASQDTMVSLAAATGGRIYSGANDLNGAFTQVVRDTAAYYLLGYSSSNALRDGRFRRVQVRVKKEDVRVEARAGYYADRDFAHTGRADREAQLEESLAVPTDAANGFEVRATTTWLRLQPDRFSVPIVISSPNLPTTSRSRVQLDVLAVVEDEQGRSLARLRDTVDAPTSQTSRVVPFAYTGSAVLPPGRYVLKAVVRENVDGALASIHTDINIPDLGGRSLAVSGPVVGSSEGGGARSLYVEVYDALRGAPSPMVVSAAFFKDSVRVLQTDLRPAGATRDREAGIAAYTAPVATGALDAGRYLCQITVVDPATGRFAIMRTDLLVE